jgi:hypothetical protein
LASFCQNTGLQIVVVFPLQSIQSRALLLRFVQDSNADFRRDSARRSYRSNACNRVVSFDTTIASLPGPSGAAVGNCCGQYGARLSGSMTARVSKRSRRALPGPQPVPSISALTSLALSGGNLEPDHKSHEKPRPALDLTGALTLSNEKPSSFLAPLYPAR